jgi:S-adenosylmethionine-diacylgycerolhomoserine-N-methlytransferase
LILAGSTAQAMDEIYRYQRHFYDLTRKYYLLGRDRLIAELKVPRNGSVLEVGCGTGRNLILIAKAYPKAHLFGLDISSAMLETAQAAIDRAGLSGRIRLAQGDAAAFDAEALFGRAAFDRVIMSYTISMIPPWQAALAQGAAVVGRGGALHLVDFGQQEGLPRAFRAILYRWLRKFEVTPRADLREVVSELGEHLKMSVSYASLWRGYAWSAVLARE